MSTKGAHLRGVGLNKQSSWVWGMLQEREREGGSTWDAKVLQNAPKPPRRVVRHGRRKGSPTPPAGDEDEDEEESDGDPFVDDPPSPSKIMSEREKPEPPARVRRKILSTVAACYMPKYQKVFDTFKDEAQQYADSSGIGAEKIRRLHREFLQFAKPVHDIGQVPELDMPAFFKLTTKHGIIDKPLLTKLKAIQDRDKLSCLGCHSEREEGVNFKDYVDILAIFKSENRAIHARTLFQMCDVDGDRQLGKLELLRVVNQGIPKGDKRVVISAILDEMMGLMGIETVAEIHYTNFMESIITDDAVWELFKVLSPFTRMITQAGGEMVLQRSIT